MDDVRKAVHDFGPGVPRVHVGVRRVRFYTDFLLALRAAIRDVWGCGWFRRHDDTTIAFEHVGGGGRWWVNRCSRCGRERACASHYQGGVTP